MRIMGFLGLLGLTFGASANAGMMADVVVARATTNETSVYSFAAANADSKPRMIDLREKGLSCTLKFIDIFGVNEAEVACGDTHPAAHKFTLITTCAGTKDSKLENIMGIESYRKKDHPEYLTLGVRCYPAP